MVFSNSDHCWSSFLNNWPLGFIMTHDRVNDRFLIFEWPVIGFNILVPSHQSPKKRHQSFYEVYRGTKWLTLLWNRSCCLGQVARAQSVDLWHYLHRRHPCWLLQQEPALAQASVVGCTYGPCGALQCCHCRSWSSQYWSWTPSFPSRCCYSALSREAAHPGRTCDCHRTGPRAEARC